MVEVLSIGHSSHAISRLRELLHAHGVETVVDVRSTPYSQRFPDFALPALRQAVREEGMKYLHMPELGGRPADQRFYDDSGHVLYRRVAESEGFSRGLKRLLKGAEQYRVAVLCSEEDPVACHRWRLIGRAIHQAGSSMLHIRGDGRLETHEQVLRRDEAKHPEAYQLRLLDSDEDQWRSTKPVRS